MVCGGLHHCFGWCALGQCRLPEPNGQLLQYSVPEVLARKGSSWAEHRNTALAWAYKRCLCAAPDGRMLGAGHGLVGWAGVLRRWRCFVPALRVCLAGCAMGIDPKRPPRLQAWWQPAAGLAAHAARRLGWQSVRPWPLPQRTRTHRGPGGAGLVAESCAPNSVYID